VTTIIVSGEIQDESNQIRFGGHRDFIDGIFRFLAGRAEYEREWPLFPGETS
jgi:hypothetical protein